MSPAGRPAAGKEAATPRATPPRPRKAQPVARKAQPAVRKAQPVARKAQPVARKAQPAARKRTPPVARSYQPGPAPPRRPVARPARSRRPPIFRLPPPRIANPDRRVRLALVAALLVFTVFGGRLVQLQGLDATALAAKALKSRSTTDVLPAHRGDILDTTGATLATSLDRVNITVDQQVVRTYNNVRTSDLPQNQRGVAGAARVLAPILGKSVPALTKKLTGNRRFAYVIKNVEPMVWGEIVRLGIPGLYDEQATRRTYPGHRVAASVVGFLGSDGRPLSGIERTDNSLLQGTAGKLTYEKGKGGQEIATGMSAETAPVPGRSVQLTINADLQYATQEALAEQVSATGAKSGTAVILDPQTFDVLALADAPTFDANAPGHSSIANRDNRALTEVFEPGSTSKVITAAAAIEEHKATPLSRLTVPNQLVRAGKAFSDAEVHGTEQLTLAGVLDKSSNIGAIEIGERLPPSTMYNYLAKFGLGSRTGVGLPESRGILAPSQDWSGTQRYTVLFGQGLSVTALQSAAVFATIANGGVRMTPRLVKAVTDSSGKLQPTALGPRTRVVSAKTARQVREMLEGVVGADGTAEAARIPGYRVAGKTGTAQYYDSSYGKYGGYHGYTASFVGMAPADKPRLVMAVFLQQPQTIHFGGTAAAPVFQKVMTYALAHQGIAPTGTKAPKVPIEWP